MFFNAAVRAGTHAGAVTVKPIPHRTGLIHVTSGIRLAFVSLFKDLQGREGATAGFS